MFARSNQCRTIDKVFVLDFPMNT